ncbi:MAG: nuclear transport factor 2 family protein [Bryobacteraceae bacterium]|nr:nuclear transport factor 2 family protein [Bryobacteraceae bacterium]
MTRTVLVFLLAATLALADATEEVRDAARGWTDAAVKQDAGALDRFLATDLQYAHAGGQTQNKEQYIAAVMKGPPRYESFRFTGLDVRLYDNVAVLTGFVDVKMVGQESFRVRTLQVYTRNSGQWRMAAHQSTRLSK